MTDYDERFYPFQERMRDQGLPELFIDLFAHYYHQLLAGDTGTISESEISPVETLVNMDDLPGHLQAVGKEALSKTAIIKLNGGLGTSMGLAQAKSLLVVKEGYTFLDIIAKQAIQANVPLILMNSFATEADSRQALQRHPQLIGDVPQTFVQHMEPKVCQSDFSPADLPQNPELTWCPPGHGDIYIAMVTQGVLENLLNHGYRYAFISNADNLGATLDLSLLGHFVEQKLPFMLEVADRTESDRKGGHLAKRNSDGRLILRELAQCPQDEQDLFQDISRYRYFNTNSLWIDLIALNDVMLEHDYKLGLPMIRNSKTVDPRDRESTPVYQLETAMGSAIEVFERAAAVVVPRTRFAPVKKTNDLLVVRSDVYTLDDDFSVKMDAARDGKPPVIDLDPQYYQFVHDFDQRFAAGEPSLLECDSLTVNGDISFGQDVVAQGAVNLRNESAQQMRITDGTILADVE